MVSRRNLRVRIGVAFFALSLALSALFALATFLSFEVIRPWYAESRFAEDLEAFRARLGETPRPGTWETSDYQAYVADLSDLESLPPRLQALGPGRHQLEHFRQPSELQIEDHGRFRYLIEYDIEQIEAIEGEITRFLILLLGSGVLGSSLLALAFGLWMSSRIIQPVTRLARRVEGLEALQPLEIEADAYGTDEVADLARAFEHTVRRLMDFVQREKDFAADASHELRTGVASISSSVELLMTEGHGEPTKARLQRLQRASRHLKRLIEALLVLARPMDEVEEPEPLSGTDLGPALREIAEGRRESARERQVDLDLDLTQAAQHLVPEEGLAIVVGNLIDNAIAYAPEGRVRLVATGTTVEIADDGPGIPEHELPYVFQRAFRGGSSRGRGAGLGLCIVKRLCERYGWSITIETHGDAGTTVRVDLAPSSTETPPGVDS